jgi:hypothetical protein
MFRKALAILVSTAFGISFASATENPLPQTKLSAAEVVEKNVAARGGLLAWRAVQTLLYAGHLSAGTNRRWLASRMLGVTPSATLSRADPLTIWRADSWRRIW